MKFSYLILIILLFNGPFLMGQQKEVTPDLSKVNTPSQWTLHNRSASYNKGEVHLNAQQDEGLLWLKDVIFRNGKIEVDIKGKDDLGKSFVGVAFHGVNDTTYDAVYFRPFNFKNPERSNHSVQYISHPYFNWEILRINTPGDYENKVTPVPDPNTWFHATIVVDYPKVKVFVNNSSEPSLEINQLSPQKKGWVGFFLGNNSEGWYRNLKIIPR